eukprot:Blabericola_migrator_1__2669@NODE_1758_length_3833_cov_125_489113_g1135_i0_p2_GENE_NODE_1758_length_3833_cov_125_489113_g1135_i0NODE_1758_length_3833_cov_125_489113_g1135_i0_p2_ORF_typecomplete_len424_score64_36DMT_YdcZ/PF04657_13/0_00016DMT_YdcZ/PF04657_13/1_6e11Brucella_OMP2/PF05244_11/0_012_NODE_1758_length_3833_cov_125_489113_g1135_i023003571
MPEGYTQTCVAAWPTTAELGYPLWLLNILPWFCGLMTAVLLAAVFRLAVIWESIWWAACGSAVSGLWIAWLCALIIPGTSLSRALRGVISGVGRNWSISFMLMGGLFLIGMSGGVIVAVRHIGVGCTYVFWGFGCLISSLYVDLKGVGWNSPRLCSLLYVPGFILFVFGICLVSHAQIMSASECVTSVENLIAYGLLATAAGALLPFQNAANGELEKFLGTPWRTLTFALLVAAAAIFPAAVYFDPEVSTLDTGVEVCILLTIIGMGLVVLMSLGLLVCPQIGAVKSTGWSIFAFSLACVPLYYFDLTSLPPRELDIPTALGVLVLGGAATLLHVGSSRAVKKTLVKPRCSAPAEDSDDPQQDTSHCEICVRNDQELFAVNEDYDLDPQWAGCHDAHSPPNEPPIDVTPGATEVLTVNESGTC